MNEHKDILKEVHDYYTEKVNTHGASPRGVDWNSLESQQLRFDQLLKVVDSEVPSSLLDFGCGFGSLWEYLKEQERPVSYTGFDISQAMIDAALQQHPDSEAQWTTHLEPAMKFDYAVASGLFNVRQDTPDEEWVTYILDTLHQLDRHTSRGFSFNILTKYSDAEYMRDYLYYADPGFLLDYCKKNFSKYVAVLHDYPLYEFTVIVRKEP
ncbi:MAG: class I SAM-dependent methyltransferase [Bacteroidota bacterium]